MAYHSTVGYFLVETINRIRHLLFSSYTTNDYSSLFGQQWDEKYPQISRSWQANWANLNTLFRYPEDIRRAIYTTNAIESLNSVIRKAINKRKLFPTDDSARKVVYLAIMDASKKWTMPIRNWKLALNRFIIEFEDRISDYV